MGGADVAGRMEAVLLRALSANGHDVEQVVAILPVPLAALESRGTWVSWEDHLALLDRADALCGGRDGLVELGRSMNRPDVLGPFTRLFAALSHKRMYELMARFSGPAAFRPVSSNFSIDDDGAFRIEVVIDSRYEGSLPFFHILHGCFEGVPGVAGLSDAIVSAEVSPHVGTFRVVPPPSRRFFSWPARVWRALTRSGSAIDEMAHQHDELRQSLRDLDAAKKRLALQEDRYRRLAENSSDIIAEWDEAGNCQYVSPSVTKLLGYLPADFQARSLELVHPDDRRGLQGALRARVQSDEAGRSIFRVLHCDGSWRWFEGASSSFTMSSGERRAVTGARDVTERIALEERLTQSQKMEAIGRLAGGVAHDFNNLLMVIVGSTELLTHGLERFGPTVDADGSTSGADVEPLLRAAQNVRGAADRAAGLTRSLLAFSRRQPVRRRALDFNEVVGDMSEILRRVLGEDIVLSIRTAPTICVVEADPTQLEQVLFNLAANARDAMLEGGRLEIELEVVELGRSEVRKLSPNHELAPGAFVRLRISDEGHGMSAETRAHAFEPFFTTKDVGDSVGLGLSTVYGIVQLNGGAVELMSDPLTGTTVDVYLPRSEASPERDDESASDEETSPIRGGRILLVEDEVSVRQIVQRMLEADGHEVLTADGGRGALAIARDRVADFDLVITDVVMPGISGPEVVRSLREIRQDLKVLFISGYAGDSDASSIESDPYSETLAKPFDSRALAAKVKEMLRG